jgi:hypothetical protein
LLQKRGLEDLHRISQRYQAKRASIGADSAEAHQILDQSCLLAQCGDELQFLPGGHRVHRAFDDLEQAGRLVDQA